MSNAWDDVADEWDEAPTVRAYAAAAFESLLEVTATAGIDLGGARVCDFGCGTGLLTERLASVCASVDAIDTSPAMLARLQAKIAERGWEHVQAFVVPPEPAEPYDVVVCSSVLAFVDDHPNTVVELARRLRPGGLFVQWDWEAGADELDHVGLSRASIEHALTRAGLGGGSVVTAFSIEADGEALRPLRGWGIRQRDA